jgi:hypothetical protein
MYEVAHRPPLPFWAWLLPERWALAFVLFLAFFFGAYFFRACFSQAMRFFFACFFLQAFRALARSWALVGGFAFGLAGGEEVGGDGF